MKNAGASGIRVLIIEDDPSLRSLFEILICRDGMQAFVAENGRRALELLDEFKPDVVLTDMIMPVMDGLTFLAEYKRRKESAPVVAMSSLPAYLAEAGKLGADAVITKPFESCDLISLVRKVADRRPVDLPEFPAALADEEAGRLRVIEKLRLNKTADEEWVHGFMKEVARYFDCPTALFSVVTEDRQFWTAGCGIPSEFQEDCGSHRSDSFCTHAVAAKSALVVQDAARNPFFKDNLFVVSAGLRFYAGVPLIARRGEALGTLCIIDSEPRLFTYYDLELLALFGRRVLSAVELREKHQSPEIPDSAFRYLSYVDDEFEAFGRPAICDLVTVEGCRAAEQDREVALALVSTDRDNLGNLIGLMRKTKPKSLIGRIGLKRLAWIVPDATEHELHGALGAHLKDGTAVEVTQLDRHVGAFRTAFEDLEVRLPV